MIRPMNEAQQTMSTTAAETSELPDPVTSRPPRPGHMVFKIPISRTFAAALPMIAPTAM